MAYQCLLHAHRYHGLTSDNQHNETSTNPLPHCFCDGAATIQFACSVSLATLIAAAALVQPMVSATASLASRAITSYFNCIILLACLPLVADVDIFHRTIRPVPEVVAYYKIAGPIFESVTATYVTVTAAVRLAAASHTHVITTDSMGVIISCAVLAFSTVLCSMFIVSRFPATS
ncbi:hypothetical protein PIB30_072594 [Stylosanthes scabra]|uniref:Uncharacterized protein n=1 Tax=Stylosanthes scabra TaxID=79078 RepID=A0ABU6YQY5_9FABA|nr:hypothetical protein [Stylosanthes scabra]